MLAVEWFAYWLCCLLEAEKEEAVTAGRINMYERSVPTSLLQDICISMGRIKGKKSQQVMWYYTCYTTSIAFRLTKHQMEL